MMDMPKYMAWAGAAAIAAVFLLNATARREDLSAARTAEPELFAFIKPMESAGMPPAAPEQPAPAEARAGSAEESLAMQAPGVEAAARQMRTQGASEDDVYRFRAAHLSAQSAEHLARMEREDATWRQRVNVYLQERNRVLAGNAAGADRNQALQQLRDAWFTHEEQERLEAYEPSALPQLRLP